jgi:hypothetical protein
MTATNINYRRTYEELEQVASKFWPSELSELEAEISVIPLLLKTQDEFTALLSVPSKSLEKLFEIVESSTLKPNLFLKHLVLLADFGGEMLQRVSREARTLFPNKRISYLWQGQQYIYDFKVFPTKGFSNASLRIDGKRIFEDHPFSDLQKDAIALLLFGSAYSDSNEIKNLPLGKCEIGDYIGKPTELAEFIKQRYIWVSRVTAGAQSNNLGQIAQKFVGEYINDHLGLKGVTVHTSGRLPKVTHTDSTTGRMTSFDLVVTNNIKYVAIEVGFQVTTNSVIERKSGQAKARYEQVEKAGHRIAYVLDGSGNFQRDTALRTICAYSHCTVAFSRSELDILCNFLREFFTGKRSV